MAEEVQGFDKIVRWFGNVAIDNMEEHPAMTRRWLMLGYELMTVKSELLPNRSLYKSGQDAYALFMRSVVDAMAHPDEMVLASIFFPTEMFRAMDLRPVTAEAISAFSSGAMAESGFITAAEGAGIPETYCSFHKVLMGMAETGVLAPARLVVSTSTACDANNLTFKTLGDLWGCARSYVDTPAEASEASVRYVADQFRETAALAEETFGRKLEETRLRELCRRSASINEKLWHTLPLRVGRYTNTSMTVDMMEMLDFHLSDGTPEAEHVVDQMLEDYASAPAYDGVSVVWAHVSPYFLQSIGSTINQSPESQIIASDMMFDRIPPQEPMLFGPDDPYEFMAERLINNAFNGSAMRRAERLRLLCDQTAADGVVLFCHWGCKQTAGAAQLIRHALEDAGYPVLVLDGDGCDRDNCMAGQMGTRYSAFLEMLRARREGAAA